MPGRLGKSDRRKLCQSGPTGRIVGELPGRRIVVLFDAMDVAAFLTAKGFIRATVLQQDGSPGARDMLGVSAGHQVGHEGEGRFDSASHDRGLVRRETGSNPAACAEGNNHRPTLVRQRSGRPAR